MEEHHISELLDLLSKNSATTPLLEKSGVFAVDDTIGTALLFAGLYNKQPGNYTIVSANLYVAQKIANILSSLIGEENVLFFPTDEVLRSEVISASKELLAQIKANNGVHPNIPNFKFDASYLLTNNLEESLKDTDLIVFVISSKAVRSMCKQIAPLLNGKVIPVLNATKGLEEHTFKTMSEIIEEEIPFLKNYVVAFSGPSFALEVARDIPTKIILSGQNETLLKDLKNLLTKKPLCFEISKDRRGSEYGGAIKNVVAIGCGILDGIGDGANTKAALLTQAMQEMNLLMISQGCTTQAVYSLCGLGDAILTGMSAISRNRRLGEKLGQGLSLEEAKKQAEKN